MVMAATTTKYVFDLQPGDVYWCTADCGWITGHTYLTYGPLLCGAQCVVFEGVPSYPTPGRSWQVVEKYNVSDAMYSSRSDEGWRVSCLLLLPMLLLPVTFQKGGWHVWLGRQSCLADVGGTVLRFA